MQSNSWYYLLIVLFKKSFLRPLLWNVSLGFFSLVVSSLTLAPLIQTSWFSQHPLLKNIWLLNIHLSSFAQYQIVWEAWGYFCVLGPLFYCIGLQIYLLHQCHAVLVTTAWQCNLKLGIMIPPTLLFCLRLLCSFSVFYIFIRILGSFFLDLWRTSLEFWWEFLWNYRWFHQFDSFPQYLFSQSMNKRRGLLVFIVDIFHVLD